VGRRLTAPPQETTPTLGPSGLRILFSLYLSIGGPGKFLMGVLESHGFFVSKRVETLKT